MSSPRRRQWDSNIHDLSVHRATRLEREQRRLRHTSPNVEEARQELEERRRALAGGNFKHVLAALDQHNRARSAGQEPASIPEIADANRDANAPSDAETPAAKIQVQTTFTRREAAFEQSVTTGAISLGDPALGSATGSGGRHSCDRLLAFSHVAQHEAPHVAAVSVPANSAPSGKAPLRKSEPPPPSAPEAAFGAEDPAPPPAARRPDKLGLARLQHGLERLDAAVAGYELVQVPPESDPATAGAQSSRAAAATESGRRRRDRKQPPAPVSYLGCNEKTLELFTRFANTLCECESRRADQERLCREMEAEMKQFRAASEKRAAQADADIASLQTELSAVRREHDVQIRSLSARVAALESSRNEGYLRSLLGGLQAQEEEWASMPIPSLGPSFVSAVAAVPGARRAPSPTARLFTPLRPKNSPLGGPLESDDDSGPHQERRVSAESAARLSVPDTPATSIHAGSPVATTADATTPNAKPAAAQSPDGSIPSLHTPEASVLFKGSHLGDSPGFNGPSPSATPPPPPLFAALSGTHSAAGAPPATGNHDVISVQLSDLPAAPTADTYAQWGSWGKRFSADLKPPTSLTQPVSVQKTRILQPPGSSVASGEAGIRPWEALSNLHGSPAYSFDFASPATPAVTMAPRNKVPRPMCT